MFIPPFAPNLLIRLCFDSVLFCFFPFFFFFACNKAWSSLFNMLVYILMLCGVFAFDPDLWVIDVNDILTFGSRKMSFDLGFFALRKE
jgi:hypothetical protein